MFLLTYISNIPSLTRPQMLGFSPKTLNLCIVNWQIPTWTTCKLSHFIHETWGGNCLTGLNLLRLNFPSLTHRNIFWSFIECAFSSNSFVCAHPPSKQFSQLHCIIFRSNLLLHNIQWYSESLYLSVPMWSYMVSSQHTRFHIH